MYPFTMTLSFVNLPHYISANLLPNLVVEFYFLVQLLTARSGGEGEDFAVYGDGLYRIFTVHTV